MKTFKDANTPTRQHLKDGLLCVCLHSAEWGTTITNPTDGDLTQLGSLCCLLRILDVYNNCECGSG